MQINQVTMGEDIAYIMEYPVLDETRIAWSSMPAGLRVGDDFRLLLRADAVRQICEFTQWDETTEDNRVEQAGIMYGYIGTENPETRENPRRWGIICGIIGANCPRSTQIEIEIPGEEWIRMERELDKINAGRRENGKQPFQKMGWFHTHPNWLEPFYSELDYRLQPSQVANRERYGVVFNPHRHKWAVYSGPDAVPVRGVMELSEELIEKYSFQELSVRELRSADRIPAWLKLKPGRQPNQEETSSQKEARQELNVDTYYSSGEYPPRRVRSERNRVLTVSYEKILLAPTLFGEACELIAEVSERGRGLEVQPVAGYRRGYEPQSNLKGCIVRLVPYADWQRTIIEHYRNRRRSGSLPVLLVSNDRKICILESAWSASMWGYR